MCVGGGGGPDPIKKRGGEIFHACVQMHDVLVLNILLGPFQNPGSPPWSYNRVLIATKCTLEVVDTLRWIKRSHVLSTSVLITLSQPAVTHRQGECAQIAANV